LSGCKCDPVPKVDALHQSPTSTIFLVRLLVTPSDKCVIGVTVLEDTSSGEHKFKVRRVVGWVFIRHFLSLHAGTCFPIAKVCPLVTWHILIPPQLAARAV
jgi:hypothetical protein